MMFGAQPTPVALSTDRLSANYIQMPVNLSGNGILYVENLVHCLHTQVAQSIAGLPRGK